MTAVLVNSTNQTPANPDQEEDVLVRNTLPGKLQQVWLVLPVSLASNGQTRQTMSSFARRRRTTEQSEKRRVVRKKSPIPGASMTMASEKSERRWHGDCHVLVA